MTTVTSKRVDKLYENLPPEQLGTLAFEALLKGDESEAEKIKSVAPRATYRQVVLEYDIRFDVLRRLVDFVGLKYWYHFAHFLASKGKDDDRYEVWLGHITNLITFTHRVCEKTQLDFDLVMEHLEITQHIVKCVDEENIPVDDQLVNEWLKMLDMSE